MRASWAASRILARASMNSQGPGAPIFSILLARTIRVALLSCGFDPACLIGVSRVDGDMLMPLSHRMPLYRNMFRRYDEAPKRLSDYIRESRGSLSMIDVGANIGDTVLTTNPGTNDGYLAIEPHPDFIEYLRSNVGSIAGIVIEQLACGQTEGVVAIGEAARGTARNDEGSPAASVRMRPLDDVWEDVWGGRRVDFLKIDTDGFDVDVLIGALRLIESQEPWILYECDIALTLDGFDRHFEIFSALRSVGYERIIAFDNFGNMLDSIGLDEHSRLRRLLLSQNAHGPIYYHDVLAVPPTMDADAAVGIFS